MKKSQGAKSGIRGQWEITTMNMAAKNASTGGAHCVGTCSWYSNYSWFCNRYEGLLVSIVAKLTISNTGSPFELNERNPDKKYPHI